MPHNPLDTALSYAAAAWPVFPCRAKDEDDPHTGEVFAPKTPYPSNGLKSASLNERIIREWWRRTPDAMVGVPTGRAIKAFVLDLDIKPGVGNGHEWLERMEDEHGALPDTARARTMGGGTHIFFNYVDGIRNRGGLGVCVDVRGEGGYIIAPGSQSADGRAYEWIDHNPEDSDDEGLPYIADAPQWLLDLVLPPVRQNTASDYTYTPGGNTPYVEAAMRHELDSLAASAPGGRGYALNASAFALGSLVGAGAIERHEAEAGLWGAAQACGLVNTDGEREVRAKIRRGLDAGIRQPRSIPEGHQDNTRLVDISRMIANGLARAKTDSTNTQSRISEENTASRIDRQSTSANLSEESIQTSDNDVASPAEPPPAEQPPAEQPPAEQPAIYATPFTWIDPATLARREFAFGSHYIRKYVSVTVSPGGLGKTSNSIVEALSMTSGRDLTGVKPPQRMRVWLFNAEDPRDELERRIMAAAIHYRLQAPDLDGLFLDTGREQDLIVAVDDKRTGVRIQEPIVEAVVAQIQTHGIDAMIVDPFVSTHSVNENDNGAIDRVAKLWAQIADHTNCAIDIVHHLRKVSDREATVEDARGAVSLIGAARSVRVLNRMSVEDATAASISPQDRFSYFSVHQGKANLTKMSGGREWRKLVSVPLGNGRGLTKPQDHAGVVTEWKMPGAEEIAEGVTAEQRSRIAGLLAGQAYKAAKQAKEAWAGNAIIAAMDLDPDNKASADVASGVLRALLKEGFLTIDERRDDRSRTLQKFVVVA